VTAYLKNYLQVQVGSGQRSFFEGHFGGEHLLEDTAESHWGHLQDRAPRLLHQAHAGDLPFQGGEQTLQSEAGVTEVRVKPRRKTHWGFRSVAIWINCKVFKAAISRKNCSQDCKKVLLNIRFFYCYFCNILYVILILVNIKPSFIVFIYFFL